MIRKGIILRFFLAVILFPVCYTMFALGTSDFESGRHYTGFFSTIYGFLFGVSVPIGLISFIIGCVTFFRSDVSAAKKAFTLVLRLEFFYIGLGVFAVISFLLYSLFNPSAIS